MASTGDEVIISTFIKKCRWNSDSTCYLLQYQYNDTTYHLSPRSIVSKVLSCLTMALNGRFKGQLFTSQPCANWAQDTNPTRFEDVKTDFPIFCTLLGSQNGLSEVTQVPYTLCGSQHGLSKVIQACHAIRSSQNGLSEHLKAPYTLCGSQNKRVQASYTLCGSQHGLSKVTQASYAICGSHNGLFEHLQAPYTLWGDKNDLSEVIQTTTRFTVVITDSLNFYKPRTCFVEVKKDSPIFYKPPTRFVEVNTD